MRASCASTLDEVSLYAVHHFTRRFDVHAGIAYSEVSAGLAIAIPHVPGVPYICKDPLLALATCRSLMTTALEI